MLDTHTRVQHAKDELIDALIDEHQAAGVYLEPIHDAVALILARDLTAAHVRTGHALTEWGAACTAQLLHCAD